MSQFNTSELWLAENLGINRKKLSTFRTKSLRRFKDYTRQNNGIFYSKSGLEAVKAKFSVAITEEPNFVLQESSIAWRGFRLKTKCQLMLPAPSQHVVEEAFKAVEEGKKAFPNTLVIKTIPRNFRILICEHEGEEILVHIRDNRLFLVGMEIPVYKLGERIEFNGRLPVRKGISH